MYIAKNDKELMLFYNPILITDKSLTFESLISAIDNKGMRLGRIEMLPVRHGTHEWFEQVATEGIYVPPYLRIRHAEFTGIDLKPFEHIPIVDKDLFFFVFTEEFIDIVIATLGRISNNEAWIEYRELGTRGKRIAAPLTKLLQSDWAEQMRRLLNHG